MFQISAMPIKQLIVIIHRMKSSDIQSEMRVVVNDPDSRYPSDIAVTVNTVTRQDLLMIFTYTTDDGRKGWDYISRARRVL